VIVLISADAEVDLADGVAFYDQHGPEIGGHFCNSLLADVQSLSVVGGVHAKRFGYYCMAARRFPFGIYYAHSHSRARHACSWRSISGQSRGPSSQMISSRLSRR